MRLATRLEKSCASTSTTTSGCAATMALGGLLDAPQQQRQPQQHVGDAHDGDIAHREQRLEPLPHQLVPANARELDADRAAQPRHQIGGDAIAGRFAGQHEQLECPQPSASARPMTLMPSRLAASTNSARCSKMLRPVSTAMTAIPAAAQLAMVCGPIAGRSAKPGCCGLIALARISGALCRRRPAPGV